MPLPTWFPQRSTADQVAAVVKNFIYHTKVPVTFTSIENVFQSSPLISYSLRDVGLLLSAWGIEMKPVKIGVGDLSRLYYPAIAYLASDGGTFVLLYQLGKGEILYIHPRVGWVQESIDVFATKWEGHTLLAIPVQGCGEPDFDRKRKDELVREEFHPAKKKLKIVPEFLSDFECDHVIAISTPLFVVSQIVSSESADFHEGRNSYTAMLNKNEDPILQTIYERASELLELPVEHLEYGQCVSYSEGQEYQAHFDTIDEDTPLGQSIVSRVGQRAVTLLIYLNDDFDGGETYFPVLDYKVTPRKGTALVFRDLDVDNKVDPYSFHAGLPVFQGRKYAFNLWGWTQPFRLLDF